MTAVELARIEAGAMENVEGEVRVKEGQRYGYVPEPKVNDIIRIMFENYNSLCALTSGKTRRKKIRKINRLLRKYGVDVMLGCEMQTDWRFTEECEKFQNLFNVGKPQVSIAANNTTGDKIQRDQRGGTCAAVFDRLATNVKEYGEDSSGLARWCWIRITYWGR